MADHTNSMRESFLSEVENLREDIPHDAMQGSHVLCVEDPRVSQDIMVGLNGPTRWWRVISYPDGEVRRIEYHDSWAQPEVWTLNGEEEARVWPHLQPYLPGRRWEEG